MNLIIKILILIIIALALIKYFFGTNQFDNSVDPSSNGNQMMPDEKKDIEIIATDLEIPWEIEFLPEGKLLVAERPGRLLKLEPDKKTIAEIDDVVDQGEGGLLGMALHPDFLQNHYLYLYFTIRNSGRTSNRVDRYRLENDLLIEKQEIISGINGSIYHDGGRMVFGPDGYLYITTGDAQQENLSQNINSLNGKILRLKSDGSIPEDNPFNNAVFVYGLRNPQGLAWDSGGNLWATDHGPSGTQSGFDELNLIQKGGNYGWPVIQGDQTQKSMISPKFQSGADDTWAPAGLTYYNGSLLFGGLRGEAIYEAKMNNNTISELKTHFKNRFGRIRVVKLGPDGFLYLATSNRDGRGKISPGDDKIIKLNPDLLTD